MKIITLAGADAVTVSEERFMRVNVCELWLFPLLGGLLVYMYMYLYLE